MRPITATHNNVYMVSDLIDATAASWKEDLVQASFYPWMLP